jgi:hypothetical protein
VPEPESKRGPSQATRCVELALEGCHELFHDGDRAYATFQMNGHLETHVIPSTAARRWLAHLYFHDSSKVANGESIAAALNTVAGSALYQGKERAVHLRVAEYLGKVYIDLVDPGWRIVEISSDGWRIVEAKDAPVRFRRTKAMRALPEPRRGGSLQLLRDFLNLPGEAEFLLVVGWLVAALRARGPYPILIIHAEPGGAKSTTARILKSLTDPNAAPLRAEPGSLRDLAISAENSWGMAYDNMSSISPWLSDGLCRIATGGGFATRELYENGEEIVLDAQRPVIITGITELATRGDLLDRSILLYLPEIGSAKRKTEKQFNAEFDAARPVILGALFDVVSRALKVSLTLKFPALPRMADFAQWAAAAMPALSKSPQDFLEAYVANQGDANALTLEASAIAKHIDEVANSGAWRGTASVLFDLVNARATEDERRRRNWPKSPKALSDALRRILVNLRTAGIFVAFGRSAVSREILIDKLRTEQATSDEEIVERRF